jgi:hypothetical protein
MGELWTDEMEAELERWRASEEASSPVDFLIVKPGFRDVVLGLYNYVAAVIRYRLLREVESPWSLRQEIGFSDTDRQLGPARVAAVEEWLSDELDFFETSDQHNA